MNWPAFQHEAMATHWEIVVAGREAGYARQAAAAAFREVDRLESELSRFVESSDIARASRLRKGETAVIGDDALECLLLAAGLAEATGRAFDPAFRSGRDPALPPGAPAFTLDPDAHTITSRAESLQLDLGAVGKGYALDRVAAVLADWEVTSALAHCGGSSVLALEAPPGAAGWSAALGEGPHRREISLVRASLSGSGTAVQGEHLVDPRTGLAAARTTRAWALAAEAAVADALATAFFVMDAAAVAAFCARHPGVGGAIAAPDGRVRGFGALAES